MSCSVHVFGHRWTTWEATDYGQTRSCVDCGYRERRTCDDIGHRFTQWSKVKLNDNGFQIQTRNCLTCNYIEERYPK